MKKINQLEKIIFIIENKNNTFFNKTNLIENKLCLTNSLSHLLNIINYSQKKNTSIKYPLLREIKFKPLMTNKELKAFCSFMKPGNIYFEFGSGGSTNIASYYKIKTYSVESDYTWHKKLKDNDIKANYITIDLKSSKYGYPGKKTNNEDWKRYIQSYRKEYNADIILIDGRFRVACALDIFSKITEETIILFHDYTYRKNFYK